MYSMYVSYRNDDLVVNVVPKRSVCEYDTTDIFTPYNTYCDLSCNCHVLPFITKKRQTHLRKQVTDRTRRRHSEKKRAQKPQGLLVSQLRSLRCFAWYNTVYFTGRDKRCNIIKIYN